FGLPEAEPLVDHHREPGGPGLFEPARQRRRDGAGPRVAALHDHSSPIARDKPPAPPHPMRDGPPASVPVAQGLENVVDWDWFRKLFASPCPGVRTRRARRGTQGWRDKPRCREHVQRSLSSAQGTWEPRRRTGRRRKNWVTSSWSTS